MKRLAGPAVALVGTCLAAWWFAAHPDHLLLGVTPQETLVPWWYQAAAFPAYLLLLVELALEPTHRVRRALLLGVVSVVAVVRLAGLIPLSGHATFLAAVLVFTFRRSTPVFATALLGLAVTTTYKLLWHDELFFGLSVACGVALGAALRERAAT